MADLCGITEVGQAKLGRGAFFDGFALRLPGLVQWIGSQALLQWRTNVNPPKEGREPMGIHTLDFLCLLERDIPKTQLYTVSADAS